MAGLGIALRGIGKAVKRGISKIGNMSDKTAGTVTMAGVGAAVVGGGELLKRKKRMSPVDQAKFKKMLQTGKKAKASKFAQERTK